MGGHCNKDLPRWPLLSLTIHQRPEISAFEKFHCSWQNDTRPGNQYVYPRKVISKAGKSTTEPFQEFPHLSPKEQVSLYNLLIWLIPCPWAQCQIHTPPAEFCQYFHTLTRKEQQHFCRIHSSLRTIMAELANFFRLSTMVVAAATNYNGNKIPVIAILSTAIFLNFGQIDAKFWT